MIDEGPGTLSLNGPTTITNTDNGGAGSNIGLTVAGSASITGSGPLDLQSAAGSFNYESTAPNDGTTPGSIYSGPISGAGVVGLLSAMVQKSVRCAEHGASRAMVRCAKPPTGWVTVNGGLTPRAQRTVNGGLRFTHPTRAVFRSARARFALASVFATYARAAVVALVLLLAGSAFAGTVSIALVPVGDPGNVADPATNFGAVAYPYSMGEYDVTMGQYTAFLNAVATTGDPYGLWTVSMSSATPTYGITRTTTSGSFSYSLVGNSANVPVTEVSWGDAARFVNWLQNGEPNAPEGQGTTETGTYALNGSTGSAQLMAVTRSTTASWVIPTVNEWYKSAYYVGGGTNASYWLYPTQNDNLPSNVLSATGTNNANYTAITNTPPFAVQTDPTDWLTPVGAFMDSPGPYGTFDQGGNVWQWLEDPLDGVYREARGGSFSDDGSGLLSTEFDGGPPNSVNETFGFRVAYVPEPRNTASLACLAVIALMFLMRGRPASDPGRERICCRILTWLRARAGFALNSRKLLLLGPKGTPKRKGAHCRQHRFFRPMRIRATRCAADADNVLLGSALRHHRIYVGHNKCLLEHRKRYVEQSYVLAGR